MNINMQFTLNLNKSAQENAEDYFAKAKKLKKKIDGTKKAIEHFKKELENIEKCKELLVNSLEEIEESTYESLEPKKWYHPFRWFISSEGFLCVGGRDASTNEIIIKRYAEKQDLIFHTDAPGSPFFVVKKSSSKESLGEATLNETAVATASYSRAWKLGISYVDVYYVNPDQVGKEAKSGEYLTKGAFVVSGRRNYLRVELKLAVGIIEAGEIMGGPVEAVKKHCKKYFIIEQGKDKPSDAAKKIKKHLSAKIDDIIRVLPSGECKVILFEKLSPDDIL